MYLINIDTCTKQISSNEEDTLIEWHDCFLDQYIEELFRKKKI